MLKKMNYLKNWSKDFWDTNKNDLEHLTQKWFLEMTIIYLYLIKLDKSYIFSLE
jgi:hypothetical protein